MRCIGNENDHDDQKQHNHDTDHTLFIRNQYVAKITAAPRDIISHNTVIFYEEEAAKVIRDKNLKKTFNY